MFDKNKSKSFHELSKLCSDLSVGGYSKKEIFCEGVCNCRGKEITIFVESFPDRFEDSLQIALQILRDPSKYEAKAKKTIAKDFLDIFNEDWNTGDGDIDEKEFINNLALSGISIFRGTVVGLNFSENGMFGGHTLAAYSQDKGETFTETDM